MENTEQKEEIKYPCATCGQETVLCPICDGGDSYAMDGQHGGFFVCQNEDCKQFQYCCGC
jgi:hypothetical protein